MTDFSTVLKDIHDHDIVETVMEAGLPVEKPATLARISANALILAYPDEVNLAGAEKVKRFELAMRVMGAKKPKLEAEEVVLLKERIAKAYGPLIVGRAWQLLG